MRRAATLMLATFAVCSPQQTHAVDLRDTLLLEQPDISDRDIAFVYDNDVWIASRDRSPSRRLTTAEGAESAPHFSPDGSLIAFSGNYDGNVDVYVIPVAGGPPTRLTWHGGPDIVQGFLPDGRVLFSSYRYLPTDRMMQLFAVPIDGRMPERIPVPDGDDAQVSPDGARIAYSTMPPAYKSTVPQAKNYRGGDASRIWIMDLRSYDVQQIPQPPGRCNDLNPVWLRGRIYFASDRNGEFNVYSFDPATSRVEQLSHHSDFPVLNLNDGGGRLVYEQAGALHVFDPESAADRRLTVAVGSDLRETRSRYVNDPGYVRSVAPSPDMQSMALEYRGEIVTLPVDAGPMRNLTGSTGANDRSPAWSFDGKRIAWFSDLSGEYALYIRSPDAADAARRIDLHGAGFYEDLKWSPDGRYLSFRDNSLSLYIVDVQSGQSRRIAQEPEYASSVAMKHNWAPDSNWLAYTVAEHGLVQTVYLYSLSRQRSFRASDALVDVDDPVFDPDGRALYVTASVDAGPVRDWFTQSRAGLTITKTLYAIALPFNRVGDGVQSFPETTGPIRNVQVARSQQVLYLTGRSGDAATLVRYTPGAAKPQSLLEGVSDYRVANDGTRILYRKGNAWSIAEIADGINESGARRLPVDGVSVLVEPMAEWRQIAREAWRIKRDYFYAANYHGTDWNAMWTKYEPFLQHAATRADVSRILYWMSTELAVGHSYVFPGEAIDKPPHVSVGLLGADYEIVQARYRFAKIYGAGWTADLVAPLRAHSVKVAEGEFLLKVGDIDVRAPDSLYKFFQGTADRPTVLTVGAQPDGRDARRITVVPVDDEMMLRRMDWIESNLRKVDAATNGRVAYVHVSDTSNRGLALFKRYFYPQSHKEAIIIDARFNGGGSFADYYIDILRRADVGRFATRYGEDQRVPRGAILGPKVMITNKMARSGGDLLPYMFRKLGLGPIVGTSTTGALVGNIGVPALMDGGLVTAPNFGFWTGEEGWTVENEGVQPDIEVEQSPAAINAGRDPQLDQAINTALQMLADHPAPSPVRPPYPSRATINPG